MKKTFAAAALAAGLLAGSAAPVTAPAAVPAALPACESEDYAGPVACRWDATSRGNGAGLSFTWDGAGMVSYAAPGLDAELQRCADIFLPLDATPERYDFCYSTQLDLARFTYKNA